VADKWHSAGLSVAGWLGWESRMDSHGRVFYIDHTSRTTTWQRPTSTITDDSVDEHRRQLDRRFYFYF